jgi:uncharacterized protein (TIGR00296 family)
MDFRSKYLKYKTKYFKLKGGSFIDPSYPPDFILGKKCVRAILLPHAGSRFVKDIMDYIFNDIDHTLFNKIIIISTNHYDKQNYKFDSFDEITLKEHSFQSVKPYIDRFNKPVKIYVIGTYTENFINEPINIDDTLIIANTDLLHYGSSYKNECPNDIEKYNMKIINQIINKEHKISNEICGYNAIRTFLYIIKKLKLEYTEFVYNSSDKIVKSDIFSSVGYCGIIFNSNEDSLIKNTKLAGYARKILEEHFANKNFESFYLHIKNINGVFVTIRKNKALRGCIGTFHAKHNLLESISEMTLSSAFNDSRFNPITDNELSSLDYDVTLLRKPMEININDIFTKFITGLHGITIIFEDNNSATYLASVMIELFGMKVNEKLTKDKFNEIVESLRNKAGSTYDIKRVEIYECLS